MATEGVFSQVAIDLKCDGGGRMPVPTDLRSIIADCRALGFQFMLVIGGRPVF